MIRNILLFLVLIIFFNCKRPSPRLDAPINSSKVKTYTRKIDDGTIKSRTNIVKMTQAGGVYTIPIEINDINMDIIFDTGASSISISETEVIFLIKQGKITEDDILGIIQFQDATGRISEGTLINLKKVKIGNKEIYDVEASVVHNLEAPLLLGQSALKQFGEINIDYDRNEITFK